MRWTALVAGTALTRWATRRTLRAWARHGKAHGYFYQMAEAFGGHLATAQPVPVTLPNGMIMPCDLHDHVQRAIYYQGVYEMIEARLFMRLIRPGMTVVDAGANVGQYTLLSAGAVGPTGVVHAFEPVPRNHDRILAELQANNISNVRLNRAGLWREPTTIELGLAADMTENDGSFSVGVQRSTSAVPMVTAPALRFDDYETENKLARVDLVKMDIEGSELAALQGMEQTLRRDQPTLLLEVNRRNCEACGYRIRDLFDLLVGRLGYRAWAIGISNHHWRELADPAAIVQENCFFTPGDLPAELRAPWDYRSCIRWAASQGRPHAP